MCGRFAQYSSRDEYFESIGLKTDEITFDPEPLGRYNVAPGTKVLLLNEQDDELRLDPVYWGYGPEWWDKQPLINARRERPHVQTALESLPRNRAGRWVVRMEKDGGKKQPY
nr:SOS response-associated peptidase family protein [Erwinia billingiae]